MSDTVTTQAPSPLLSLIELRDQVIELGEQIIQQYQQTTPALASHKSARNLAHYLALRRFDLRPLQDQLAELGASSLGHCESHVLATLERVITLLQHGAAGLDHQQRDFHEGRQLLEQNSLRLFGPFDQPRKTRIMVTLPLEAAGNRELVVELINHGMNCARINCAHDAQHQWLAMVENIHQAREITGKECVIMMDLAGQKLRTVLRSAPTNSVKIKKGEGAPALLLLRNSRLPKGHYSSEHSVFDMELTLPSDIHRQLAYGDRLQFNDSRDKKRQIIIDTVTEQGEWIATCEKNSLIDLATLFSWQRRDDDGKFQTLSKFILTALPSHRAEIRLQQDDSLILARKNKHCTDDPNITPPRIGCSHPEIIDALDVGSWVWFDDGKIGTVVEEIDDQGARLTVHHLPGDQAKLYNDKGINLPNTPLQLDCLTDKDLQDLDFICKYADIVGFSFVQTAEDMQTLIAQLQQRQASHLAIVAKIETQVAVRNLPEIIFSALPHHSLGIMIARGDLAVELGWERMVEIQEELLWLCEAAHVPVIWATQVLESLSKKGHTTRPELTDAAMSGQADCVMLNKGEFILRAVDTLNNVLTRMQDHHYKKDSRLRALHW